MEKTERDQTAASSQPVPDGSESEGVNGEGEEREKGNAKKSNMVAEPGDASGSGQRDDR